MEKPLSSGRRFTFRVHVVAPPKTPSTSIPGTGKNQTKPTAENARSPSCEGRTTDRRGALQSKKSQIPITKAILATRSEGTTPEGRCVRSPREGNEREPRKKGPPQPIWKTIGLPDHDQSTSPQGTFVGTFKGRTRFHRGWAKIGNVQNSTPKIRSPGRTRTAGPRVIQSGIEKRGFHRKHHHGAESPAKKNPFSLTRPKRLANGQTHQSKDQ